MDLLVPLETNLEKDTKVVQVRNSQLEVLQAVLKLMLRIFQSEQKRFLQQHKQRTETYSKAAAMMKKQRKKSRGSSKTGLAMDKELKVDACTFEVKVVYISFFQNMQVLEEEKTKLDAFCEQSLKNVSNLTDL